MEGPPPPHPQHTQNQRCMETPKAVERTGCPNPAPKVYSIPPGLDDYPRHLQAPRNNPFPALAHSIRHQMPSPRTQVGVESKEDNRPPKSQFCLQGPIEGSRAHTQPKEPRADGSFSWGRGWDMRNCPLLFGGGGASPGPCSCLSLQHSLTITLSPPPAHSHPSTAPSY